MLDLSRTDGITLVDKALFKQDTVMHTLLLPASLEQINSAAFSGSTKLESVTCYATTPPTMPLWAESNPFKDTPATLIIFVPAESLPLYAAADGWKDMNLMPITQGVHSLTVNLPSSETSLKDMYMELVNNKTGQAQRLVLTNRTQYTFPNLISGTQYNIYKERARGHPRHHHRRGD